MLFDFQCGLFELLVAILSIEMAIVDSMLITLLFDRAKFILVLDLLQITDVLLKSAFAVLEESFSTIIATVTICYT